MDQDVAENILRRYKESDKDLIEIMKSALGDLVVCYNGSKSVCEGKLVPW